MSQAVYVVTMKDSFDKITYTRIFTNLDAARKCLLYKVGEYNNNVNQINKVYEKYDVHSWPLEKDNDDCFSVFSYGGNRTKIYIELRVAFDSFEI